MVTCTTVSCSSTCTLYSQGQIATILHYRNHTLMQKLGCQLPSNITHLSERQASMRNIILIEGQLLYSSRTTLYIASHQTLSNRCKGLATFVQSPSLFSSVNPDPWNAAYLSSCLFLSSSSRSTAPCLPRLASQLGQIHSSLSVPALPSFLTQHLLQIKTQDNTCTAQSHKPHPLRTWCQQMPLTAQVQLRQQSHNILCTKLEEAPEIEI